MTGYASAALRGRESARETNTRFKLRTLTAYREWTEPANHFAPPTLYGELTGSCGHVIERTPRPSPLMKCRVGERRRCPQCPADPPKSPFVDACTYGYGTELGERDCRNLARFTAPGYGLICRKHHLHLLAGGYLDGPCPPFTPSRERRAPAEVPFVPELSPPVRGHLRVV
jgi:hypothetical protein